MDPLGAVILATTTRLALLISTIWTTIALRDPAWPLDRCRGVSRREMPGGRTLPPALAFKSWTLNTGLRPCPGDGRLGGS